MALTAGIQVDRRTGAGEIHLGDLRLAMTDGRTATERSVTDGPCALFDLALDYARSPRIGIAFPEGLAAERRARAVGFFQALGKKVSVIDDAPGMVVMRTVAMLANEAADALHQGLANAEDIDRAMTHGANYPLGPLEWSDRIGSARVVHVIEALNKACPDGRYRASPLLRRRALAALSSTETEPAS